jgi:RNA polymerase sigma-70 factor, ECF subfamily
MLDNPCEVTGSRMESMRTKVLARAQESYALEDLLVRIASADEDAFRSLYDRTAGRLFAVCLRIARHRRLAEELLQESYVRIWRRAREFDPGRSGALVWMIAIARNHALDVIRLRMRQDRPPDEATLEAADGAALGTIEAKFALSALGRCLGELTSSERHAIVLAYRDGLNYAQLAVLLGVSVETVKTSVSRGLARLRDCLEPP